MNKLRRVGLELHGPTNSCSGIVFPSLEVLEFRNLQGLEEWSTSCGDNVGIFPCLHEISIVNCPKLDVVEIELIPSLRVLHVEQCSVVVLRKLKYVWESEEACKNLMRLQNLVVRGCVNLVSLGEKEVHLKISMESVREVQIEGCPILESYNRPNTIEKLEMFHCPSLTSLTFSTMCSLPYTLMKLQILACDNLQVSWLPKNFLLSLESLAIARIPNLRLFPEGCLVHLTTLKIHGCDNIESIPDNGYGFLPFLCLRDLEISNCKNIKSFPRDHLGSLTSLEEMCLYDCPRLDYSFPCGLWPPNLSRLRLGGLKKPISEWGLQNFPTSLVQLSLQNSGLVSFAKAEDMSYSSDNAASSFLLPSSLSYLSIIGFTELESLSKGLQHLSCLEHLFISLCPKVRDLPETLLPSLLSLWVSSSTELGKKCSSKKGKYWPIISKIPDLQLD
ncbi:hypothetical protein L1987_84176 [Smallanthus sonchifolius]|uniref:Uncharacterized protein n=1 Tax=Smallanthus sonchifolius TaxID=185202 RepID=A0ACB8YD78_9ASTR|nr:hypothetical protein L1987_84176 [Smallanthus sonchifolius]